MDRIKRIKNKDYTVISNVFLRDKNLSAKAKGVLSMVMGLPDDWDFSIRGICSIAKEGKTAIYNIIAELKNNGYCESITLRNEVSGVVVGADYSFAEEPIFSPTYTLAQLNKAKKVVLLSNVLDKLKSLNLNSEELNPVNLNSVILNMGFETQLNTKDIKYLLNQLLKDKSILSENENLSNEGLTSTLQDQEETPPPVAVAPPSPKRDVFTPPNVVEVEAYCQERNNGIDANYFVDYYTSNGWMVGRTKMKDWKAAVRNWERNTSKTTNKQQSNGRISKASSSEIISAPQGYVYDPTSHF